MTMRRIFWFLLLLAGPAWGQQIDAGSNVVPGFLTTTNCPGGNTPCFVSYSAANPLPVTGSGGGVVATTPVAFGATVTASAVQLSSHAFVFGPVLTAGISNTSVVCIGGSGVNTTIGVGGTGYCLTAGASISYGINNTNLLYIIGTNTTDTVAVTGN